MPSAPEAPALGERLSVRNVRVQNQPNRDGGTGLLSYPGYDSWIVPPASRFHKLEW